MKIVVGLISMLSQFKQWENVNRNYDLSEQLTLLSDILVRVLFIVGNITRILSSRNVALQNAANNIEEIYLDIELRI